MDVRQATTDDIEGVRQVARRSLRASYDFLDEETLTEAVDQWYSDDALETSIVDDQDTIIVGVVEGDVAGFTQSAVVGEEPVGEIRWIHVDPDRRDQGIGAELLDRTREVLRDQGVGRIRGVVLEGNEAGREFYEDHGFGRVDDRPVTVADRQHRELVYETAGVERPVEGTVVLESRTVDGQAVYVARDEGERGSDGPFHPVYSDRATESLYGWLCGACGSADNAMDPMGRLECNDCGNLLKPTRWDAAYL